MFSERKGMFYTFHQSNPGGSHDVDEKRGISVYVVIEACSATEANVKAQGLGIYFDGVDKGRDCPCCNDRWYDVNDTDAAQTPEVYGEPVVPGANFPAEDERNPLTMRWTTEGIAEGFIHYLNGKIEPFWQF